VLVLVLKEKGAEHTSFLSMLQALVDGESENGFRKLSKVKLEPYVNIFLHREVSVRPLLEGKIHSEHRQSEG